MIYTGCHGLRGRNVTNEVPESCAARLITMLHLAAAVWRLIRTASCIYFHYPSRKQVGRYSLMKGWESILKYLFLKVKLFNEGRCYQLSFLENFVEPEGVRAQLSKLLLAHVGQVSLSSSNIVLFVHTRKSTENYYYQGTGDVNRKSYYCVHLFNMWLANICHSVTE